MIAPIFFLLVCLFVCLFCNPNKLDYYHAKFQGYPFRRFQETRRTDSAPPPPMENMICFILRQKGLEKSLLN